MYILVKGLNGRLVFMMDDEVDFHILMKELKSLLKESLFVSKDYFPKAFFDFKSRILNESQMKTFLHIILESQAVIFDGIAIEKAKPVQHMKLIDRTIHAGEIITVYEDTLITGQINPGAIVYFKSRLYVLKGIMGTVEGINENAIVSSSCYKNANIRYFGNVRQDFTSLEMTLFYYKDKQIYLNKGDELICQE
ncbi:MULTISPECIES: hypothetical protein [Coprobacillaceae]|uniref:hypothetical protein n=1 Tax=Coprobacillaceae TaxID=2810280 RepID=UPI000E513D87|nr:MULTISPECIES: hypothetical protein [Coprobacillaceae]RHM62406.1 hypothetical protein DWZ53_03415 [Coprobacillus sp. AF33-1AC]RHS95653.1 hypothetical protein DW911_02685 [Erysipelatoclostridium sp. AM42-17]